jgi:hypothetical protein
MGEKVDPSGSKRKSDYYRRQVFFSPLVYECLIDLLLHQDDFSCAVLQQLPGSSPQLHSPLSISLPRSAALIIAHAHPTPLCTVIACTGQFMAQAPHSIHETDTASTAVSLPGTNTPCGQTLLHIPQFIQRSGSYRSVFPR